MDHFRIEHRTIYRYARPVAFGPHRLVLRPPGSADLRVVSSEITTWPSSTLRWTEDALGNAIAHASFGQRGTELRIESRTEVEHLGALARLPAAAEECPLPIAYDPIDHADLARTIERHHADPRGVIERWARGFVRNDAGALDAIRGMVAAIHGGMRYQPRDAEGTQEPIETLERGVGACRDFAQLLIEGCRSLGIASRFVSGYLYDPARDVGSSAPPGGATHAWAQVYLPGAGWIEIDPTHGRIGSECLIRVAVSRDARWLAPVSGTWIGFPGDAIGMEVHVHVSRVERAREAAA